MYIVTGAAGLIGSAMVWHLNELGIYDIIAVDHLGSSEKWKNLRALKFRDYFEKDEFIDQLRQGTFDDLDFSGIIHLGACSSTLERDASYLAVNNFEYSKELALYALKMDVRFVYASSCATYGMAPCVDDEEQIDDLRPLNAYGYSKQIFDQWARNAGILSEITGCKFSNIFGPNEWHKGPMRSVVAKAYDEVRESGAISLFKSTAPEYPDGGQMRDFLYVKDAVKMVKFLFDKPEAKGIYNIGSGRAETWNALAGAVFAAMNVKEHIKYVDMPESLRGRYQNYTKASMEKLYALGYPEEPMSLTAAVEDYLVNYTMQGKYLGD